MLASLWGELCLASVQTPPTVPLFSLLWNLSKWAGLSHPTALPHESSLCEESGFLRSTIKFTDFLINCVYRPFNLFISHIKRLCFHFYTLHLLPFHLFTICVPPPIIDFCSCFTVPVSPYVR